MMKTGEMKWNGGSQNTGGKGGQIGKVFRRPLSKDTRKWEERGRERQIEIGAIHIGRPQNFGIFGPPQLYHHGGAHKTYH